MMGFVLLAQAELTRGANDLTVIDSETKLEWQDSYAEDKFTNLSYRNAITECEGLKLDGKEDWRLPNINELKSIVVDTQYEPSINSEIFKKISSSFYWSSTSRSAGSQDKWVISFSNANTSFGRDHYHYSKNQAYRCVRNY